MEKIINILSLVINEGIDMAKNMHWTNGFQIRMLKSVNFMNVMLE